MKLTRSFRANPTKQLTKPTRKSSQKYQWPQHRLSSSSQASSVTHPTTALTQTTASELTSARKFCLDTLRKHDIPSSLLLPYIPRAARDAYIALRAFNIEVARTADTTSTPTIGSMRLQFQREAVLSALEGAPPKQPIAILLASAAEALAARGGKWSKSWFLRIIAEREKYLSNPPYASMASLESYAENTYSTLLYLTLQALPMSSLTADHVASHIGKAAGISAVLRGLPLIAFPRPQGTHSNQGGLAMGDVGATRHGAVMLPLDIMAETGVREEDVLRNGSSAKGLRDAVFAVATRANDHLITARQMVANVRAGEEVGHEFEYLHEEEHAHPLGPPPGMGRETQAQELERAFGVFIPAVATQIWLDRLQGCDFDVFDPKLRVTDWRLPFKAFWAYRRRRF